MGDFNFVVENPSLGLRTDLPPTRIGPGYASDLLNIEYRDGFVCKRRGFSKLQAAALNGQVMALCQFYMLDGSDYLLAVTTRDIYLWSGSAFTLITPTYAIGTVTVLVGTPTIVTGAGTDWVTADVKAGDKITIGANTYTVLTRDSLTQVTLTASAAAVAGVAYSIRQLLTAVATDHVSWCAYLDLWIMTNGRDKIIKWDGSGNCEVLAGNPPRGKFVLPYYDHLLVANITTPGVPDSIGITWSITGNPETWVGAGSGTIDLPDVQDPITGMFVLRNVLVILRGRSIWHGEYVGYPAYFSLNAMVPGIGCTALGSAVVRSDNLFFLSEGKVYTYNTSQLSEVSTPIRPTLESGINQDYQGVMAAGIHEGNAYYLLSVPSASATTNNYTYVLCFRQDAPSWAVWNRGFTAFGWGRLTSGLTWDDMDWTWDSESRVWDDPAFGSSQEMLLVGDANGYVYSYGSYGQEEEALINATITWGPWAMGNDPFGIKEIDRLWIDGQRRGATLRVLLGSSEDGVNITWSDPIALVMAEGVEAFCDFLQSGRYFCLKIENGTTGEDLEIRSFALTGRTRGAR